MTYVVRTDATSPVTMTALKQQVWSVDPMQAFYRTATLEELISRTLVSRRFLALLLAGFGLAAVLLAATGVYGVMSFSTAQRTREFGVRIALGARPTDIVTLVLGEGVRLAVAGLVAGALASVWFTRLFKGLLYGVTPGDPLTFAGAALLLIALTAASCYLPARRALRADPLQSFRQ
jgi:ABC-type antimicrobial peptide transport system permease subunit